MNQEWMGYYKNLKLIKVLPDAFLKAVAQRIA